MKFDVVIGNPPYVTKKSSVNIFDKFVELGNTLSKHHFGLIIPRSWYSSNSKENKKVRSMVLCENLTHLKSLPLETFPAVTVKTCYFLLDRTKKNNTFQFENLQGYVRSEIVEGVVYESKLLQGIVEKIASKNEESYAFRSAKRKVERTENYRRCVNYVNNKGVVYHEDNIITQDWDKYRLVTGYMRNSYYHVDSVQLIEPGVPTNDKCYTQMVVNSLSEGEILRSVLHSKLSKFVFDQTRTSRTFDNVQLKYLPFLKDKIRTDEELYKHFNLTEEEIQLIESTVK